MLGVDRDDDAVERSEHVQTASSLASSPLQAGAGRTGGTSMLATTWLVAGSMRWT
jgi:hypothetical protein